ncbi:MAG: hypothetical protein ACREJC_04715, partial [Tepidisphaeraceae bacterium]
HIANPGGKFESGPGGAKEASPCPRIKNITPPVPTAGVNPGDKFNIEVTNPGQVAAVKVRTESGPDQDFPWRDAQTKYEFTVPGSQGNGKVCVVFLARPDEWDWEVVSKEFFYRPPASTPIGSDDFNCIDSHS